MNLTLRVSIVHELFVNQILRHPLERLPALAPVSRRPYAHRTSHMGKKRKRSKQAAGDPAPAAATAASSSSAAAHPPSGSDDDDVDEGPPAAEEVDTAIYVVRYLARRPELFEQRVFKGLRAALHPLVELQRQRYDPVDYAARTSAALRAGKWYHSNQGSRYRRAPGATLTALPPKPRPNSNPNPLQASGPTRCRRWRACAPMAAAR